MINITQNEDVYEIRFRYDSRIVQFVRGVPGRKWNPELKFWSIPKNNLGFFLNQLKGTSYEDFYQIQSDEEIDVNQKIEPVQKIPDVDISKVKYYIKKDAKPFQHQLDTLKFHIDREENKNNHSGFLLTDEPGLGKTNSITNVCLYNKQHYNSKHCLIICCINSSKYNWVEDITEHTEGKFIPYVLGSRKKKSGIVDMDNGSKEKIEDLTNLTMYGEKKGKKLPYFIVTNIETLRYKQGKKYIITDRIIELIKEKYIDTIVIDEIHKNMSAQSAQGKQILQIKRATGNMVRWYPLTGTPIVSKPTDVFLPLKLVDGHSFNSFWTWRNEFCIMGGYGDKEIIGYKNIKYLKEMLEGNMLRRLRKDVLDLPEKMHITGYVLNTPYQTKLYDRVKTDLSNNREKIMRSMNPLAELMKLRQVNGSPELVDSKLKIDEDYLNKNAKLQKLLEYLEEIHERGEKVVIYSNWVEPLRMIYRFISKKYKVCCFTGTMTAKDRQKNKELFMNDKSYTVLIGTIGALGTSHTLTAARNVIFYDEPWTAAEKTQNEDRIYRIGTKESVNIYTILTKYTVDDRVHQIVYNKEAMSNYIVDGVVDFKKNPELMNWILS